MEWNLSKNALIEIALGVGLILTTIDMIWPTTYHFLGILGVLLMFAGAFIRLSSNDSKENKKVFKKWLILMILGLPLG